MAIHIILALSLFSLANVFLAQSFQEGFPSTQSFGSCSVPPVPYASPEQIKDRMKGYLDQCEENITQIIKNYKDYVGGIVYNLIYKDSIIWSKGFGMRNMSESGPDNVVDGDTIFRIGSITKLFTAMMMFQLRDAGALDSIDTDVASIFPEFKIKNPFKQKRGITFNQLSSHMSGLPRETPCPAIFYNGCSLPFDEIYNKLSKMELICPPGTWPQYSNLGVAVLGRALEPIGKDSWESLLEKMILQPLGMNSSGCSVDPSMMKHLAVGYSSDGATAKQIDIGFEAPAGQMYSTANDLSKFMMSIINNIDSTHPLNNSLLDSETLREWMEPVYMYNDGTGYGRPWEFMPSYNYTLHTKGGAINGYQAHFLMAPKLQTGVVMLKSSLGSPAYPLELDIGGAIISALANHLLDTDLLPPAKLPPNPQEYAGSYFGQPIPNQVGTILTVSTGAFHEQKVMYAQNLGTVVKLDWRGDLGKDMFQTSATGMTQSCGALSGGTIGAFVEFYRNQDGKVTGMMFPGQFPGIMFQKMFADQESD